MEHFHVLYMEFISDSQCSKIVLMNVAIVTKGGRNMLQDTSGLQNGENQLQHGQGGAS